MPEAESQAANEKPLCSLCKNTGRVRGLDEDLEPTVDPCVFCHPEKCNVDGDDR